MIIVDSNVWIFAEVKDAPEHVAAVNAIQSLIAKRQIGMNVVIASETFHKIAALFGVRHASERVRIVLLHPSVRWIEFGQEVAAKAIVLAEMVGVRINDALIAQQALEQRCAVLTDNVKDFRKVKGLKVVPLR